MKGFIMSEHNHFLECEAFDSEHGTGWGVRSKYFNVPAQNEGVANRIAELIQMAYIAGREDLQDEMKKALGL
jgi:hypothetical protein